MTTDKEKIRSKLWEEQETIKGPDCENCSDEMTLSSDHERYECDCSGGCSCHINAPCPCCTGGRIDAEDWWDQGTVDGRDG